jgi:hypothetical protein
MRHGDTRPPLRSADTVAIRYEINRFFRIGPSGSEIYGGLSTVWRPLGSSDAYQEVMPARGHRADRGGPSPTRRRAARAHRTERPHQASRVPARSRPSTRSVALGRHAHPHRSARVRPPGDRRSVRSDPGHRRLPRGGDTVPPVGLRRQVGDPSVADRGVQRRVRAHARAVRSRARDALIV